MMRDASVGSRAGILGSLLFKRPKVSEETGPVLPEPKVWENAAELLEQEFQPLPREAILRLP
jgi:hypothetical protein